MHEAALEVAIDPDMLIFAHALWVIGDLIPEFQMVIPEQLPKLYARLLHDIIDKRLPERTVRFNPRVVKPKMSKFRLNRSGTERPPGPTAASWRDVVALSGQPTSSDGPVVASIQPHAKFQQPQLLFPI